MSAAPYDPRSLANRLIDAGVPVVVCRPNPNRGRPMPTDQERTDQRELLVPPGWSTVTAADCDVSGFRSGVDVLAMVGGHGVDAVDVDTKDGGNVDNLPPFRSFGLTRTPSGGWHHYVRSTGIGKMSPLRTAAGHVGDYVGGTPAGGGRLLAYLPGSTRPKYPGKTYELVEDLDLDALLEHDADDDLVGALLAHGGTREGVPGRPAVKHSEVQAFHAEHSEIPARPCRYGRAAVDGLVRDADATVPGDPTRGRHGWAVAAATRAVELVRAGCATAADLDRLEATLDRVKPEGGTDWGGVLGWALANAGGTVGCGIHGPAPAAATSVAPGQVPSITTLEGPEDQQEAAMDAVAAFAVAVERQAYDLRVREAARVKVAAEKAGEVPPFDAGLLGELLARPAEPPHRVDGLIPSDAAALIVAARKTGKTTIELNLARSQITGEDFLGRFAVRPITGRVGFLNYEVSGGQIARWADEVGVPRDRLYVVNLRGRRNPLGDPDDRARLAERLREKEVESLMVDPFGRAYTGQSQNDPGEVGAWLADLDRFARGEAGATDLILSAHAGWNGERTRGASALEDWADVIITLTRDADPDEDGRWLRAFGRDVDVDEDRLHFDAGTRSLTLTGAGSRKAAAKGRHVEELVPVVVEAVKASPGITGYKLRPALRESGATLQNGDELVAVRLAVERGLVIVEDGPRKSKQYHPAPPSGPTSPHLARPTPAGDVSTSPDLPLMCGGGRQGRSSTDLARDIDLADTCPDCARNLDGGPAPACGCPDLHGTEVNP